MNLNLEPYSSIYGVKVSLKISFFVRVIFLDLSAQNLRFIYCRTILHQINENEINLTIRPSQENFFGEPSHATITIEVSPLLAQTLSFFVLARSTNNTLSLVDAGSPPLVKRVYTCHICTLHLVS